MLILLDEKASGSKVRVQSAGLMVVVVVVVVVVVAHVLSSCSWWQ
ncbi:hypothetical protein [Burkholderia vietnamiensis]|nr:hypothetical protein [Burkholderia vietnamiensis]